MSTLTLTQQGWLVEKLLVEVFLDVMYQDYCHSSIIILGSPCLSHHLEDTCDRVVHAVLGLPIKVLGTFDHHEVCREVDPPGKSTGGDQHLMGSL